MSSDKFADKLRRKYERELKNLRILPDPVLSDYTNFSAYRNAVCGRAKSIRNREKWIFNLKHYGLKDFPLRPISK